MFRVNAINQIQWDRKYLNSGINISQIETYKNVPAATQIKQSEIHGLDAIELCNKYPIKIPLGVNIEKPKAMHIATRRDITDLLSGTPTAKEAKYLWLKMATPNEMASESSVEEPNAIPLKMEWIPNPIIKTIDEK